MLPSGRAAILGYTMPVWAVVFGLLLFRERPLQRHWLGVLAAALIGSITLVPGFVAFPLAAALLKNGAGYMQIAAFVSTLMMVGVITLPMELKTFGKRAAIVRNVSALGFSLIAAVVIGVVLK